MPDEKPVSLQDVARPGTTPAAATSKPVIVGHTSMVVDPMTNPEKKDLTALGQISPANKPKIAPITVQEPKPAEPEKEAEKPEADVPEAAKKPEEDTRQEKLAELIESGEYKVSVHHQKASSGGLVTFLVTVLVIIVAAAVVLFVLSDLKIIDLGVKLPFHIFKQ